MLGSRLINWDSCAVMSELAAALRLKDDGWIERPLPTDWLLRRLAERQPVTQWPTSRHSHTRFILRPHLRVVGLCRATPVCVSCPKMLRRLC